MPTDATGACCVKCIADTNTNDECVPDITEAACDELNFGQLHEWIEGGECSQLQSCDDSCFMYPPVPAMPAFGLLLLLLVMVGIAGWLQR